jgi:hypothetical protein
MKTFLKILIWLSILLIVMTSIFFWFESTKEVRVLCQYFRPGQTQESVIRTLDTGNLLSYRIRQTESSSSTIIDVTTPYNLGTSQCQVSFTESGLVQISEYMQSFHLERLAAVMGGIAMIGMMIFQLLLSLGWSLGHIVWGKPHRQLSVPWRWVNGVSVPISMFGIMVLLEGSGMFKLLRDPELISYSLGVFYLLFVLATVILLLVSNKTQRKRVITWTTILCICYWTEGIATW